MAKFSESSHNILEEYFDILGTSRTGTDNSYVLGKRRTIVAEGSGSEVILYQLVDGAMSGHRFLIQSITDNYFKFQYRGKESKYTGSPSLTMGEEIYFRKDSYFHVWLRQNTAYENFVNTDKTFIYFGKIYSVSNESSNYNIIFEGLKDFAIDALPEHNQTDNVKELMKIFFDAAYHDIYNMTKTLWSFFDAKEVNLDHLNYLATRAGVETDKDKVKELPLREFVDNLPYWLKRKGTYTSYYIIYKLLLENTTNKLNIYERWVEWCLRSKRQSVNYLLDKDFDNHHILEYYGTQPNWLINNSGTLISWTNNGATVSSIGNPAPALMVTGSNYAYIDNASKPNVTIEFDCYIIPGDIPLCNLYFLTDSNGAGQAFRLEGRDMPGVESCGFLHTDSWTSWGPHETEYTHISVGVWHNVKIEISDTVAKGYIDDVYFGMTTFSNNGRYIAIHGDAEAVTGGIFDNIKITDNTGAGIYYDRYDPTFYPVHTNFADRPDCSLLPSPSGYPVMSPHYKIEVDLSSEPLGEDYIIDADSANELLRYWDYIKPVSKYVHYHMLLSPLGKIDESGESVSLYDPSLTAICDTRFTGSTTVTAASAAPPPTYVLPYDDLYDYTEIYSTDTSYSTWTINHSLLTPELIIQTYDSNGNIIYPQSTDYINKDTLKVDWFGAVRGTAYLAGQKREGNLGTAFYSDGASATWNITHTDSPSGILYQVYSGITEPAPSGWRFHDIDRLVPDTAVSVDATTLSLIFSESVSGAAFIRNADYLHKQLSLASTWNINHKMDIAGAIVQCWDHAWNRIYPENIQKISSNEHRATFSEAVSGYATLIAFERDFTEGDVELPTVVTADQPIGYWKIGTGASDTFNPLTSNDLNSWSVSGDLSSFTNTASGIGGHHVIEFSVPKEGEQTLNELGVFDPRFNMLYYTRCSSLYKPDNVQLDVVYRITKQESN